jgi:hypothetical protein
MPHIDSFSPSAAKLKELGAKRAVMSEAAVHINKALRLMSTPSGTTKESLQRTANHLATALDYINTLT